MNAEISAFLRPFSIRERSLLIIGAGITGRSWGDFLTRYCVPFSLYDRTLSSIPSETLKGWKPYLENVWDDEAHLEETTFTDVWLSPGFPRLQNLIKKVEQQARVWNDIDFFYPLLEKSGKTLIAVTGTDGKSTTVELIRHLLGDCAIACGNNDIPLTQVIEKILSTDIAQVVIELSSFMLEKTYHFRADYNIILNITPDHLDRYDSFSAYADTKHHLLLHSRSTDTYLYNLDSTETAPRNSTPRVISYGTYDREKEMDYSIRKGKYYQGDVMIWDGGAPSTFSTILFPSNIFPALIISRELGIKSEHIHRRLQNFPGLPHRLELITKGYSSFPPKFLNKNRIFVYDNSKATTLEAVITSIEYLYDYHLKPIHIILGGKSKNTNFARLADYRDKIKAYFYGEAGEIIREQSGLSGSYVYELGICTQQALNNLRNIVNGVLVLSPVFSSFYKFSNYRERGIFFKRVVNEYISSL